MVEARRKDRDVLSNFARMPAAAFSSSTATHPQCEPPVYAGLRVDDAEEWLDFYDHLKTSFGHANVLISCSRFASNNTVTIAYASDLKALIPAIIREEVRDLEQQWFTAISAQSAPFDLRNHVKQAFAATTTSTAPVTAPALPLPIYADVASMTKSTASVDQALRTTYADIAADSVAEERVSRPSHEHEVAVESSQVVDVDALFVPAPRCTSHEILVTSFLLQLPYSRALLPICCTTA
ncbi:hypothetical protein HPB51_019863 [Rhipicephalus microplus]|uniref:Uncharacterized protein n=1 Tax=Rhipicephalus microplus TaxID=6941 RepID=A0A9J6D6X0_RHIMP|nr:hypothetical protein HPB51_019863 [Rhipicephalus microplus]